MIYIHTLYPTYDISFSTKKNYPHKMKSSSHKLSTKRNSFPTNFSQNPQEIDTFHERNLPAHKMKFVAHNFPQKPVKN